LNRRTKFERRLVVRWLSHAKAAEAALRSRLEQARPAVEALNKRKLKGRFTAVTPAPGG
jgi:hypothetical protein